MKFGYVGYLGPVKFELVTGSSSRHLFEIHVCDPFRKMLILKLVWAQLNLHYKLSDLPGLFSKSKVLYSDVTHDVVFSTSKFGQPIGIPPRK